VIAVSVAAQSAAPVALPALTLPCHGFATALLAEDAHRCNIPAAHAHKVNTINQPQMPNAAPNKRRA
jgi:hypothetical protein